MACFSKLGLKRVVLDRFPVDFYRVVIEQVMHRQSQKSHFCPPVSALVIIFV